MGRGDLSAGGAQDPAATTIRPARPSDAAEIAALANALSEAEGVPPLFTEAKVLADGFGARPAFSVLLAERKGRPVGYALFHDFYNTERAARGLWLGDLFVLEEARRAGVGRRLVAAVAAEAVRRGAASLWWGVLSSNRDARAFYAALGAKDDDARILELDGDALISLSAEAPPVG